jgi:hypothetical protein
MENVDFFLTDTFWEFSISSMSIGNSRALRIEDYIKRPVGTPFLYELKLFKNY